MSKISFFYKKLLAGFNILILPLVFLFVLTGVGNSFAQQNRGQVMTLSFGSYRIAVDDDTVYGSQIMLGLAVPFSQQFDYLVQVSSGWAEGDHKNDDGSKTDIKAETNSLSGGIQWNIPVTESDFSPFLGVGAILQQYSYDFDYPESEVGETSGIGQGGFLFGGVKMSLSRHFAIVPSYKFSQVYFKAEDGDQKIAKSSGFALALVGRF